MPCGCINKRKGQKKVTKTDGVRYQYSEIELRIIVINIDSHYYWIYISPLEVAITIFVYYWKYMLTLGNNPDILYTYSIRSINYRY